MNGDSMNGDSVNDDSMDDLVALYRKVARETPRAGVDARILEMAKAADRRHRPPIRWPWFAAALAASMLIWLVSQRSTRPPPPRARTTASSAPPGYLDGRTRAYLLQMDVESPLSSSARYLLTQGSDPD